MVVEVDVESTALCLLYSSVRLTKEITDRRSLNPRHFSATGLPQRCAWQIGDACYFAYAASTKTSARDNIYNCTSTRFSAYC